jgi:hypothetical protein
MNKIEEYIKNQKIIHEQKNITLHGSTPVVVKDNLINDGISLASVISKIETIVPKFFTYGLDSIYVGDFDQFNDRGINAFYDDGSLYISNFQDDEADMIDDIVHEIAHHVEENHGMDIYGDKRLEKEFLGKRKKLYYLLDAEGYDVNIMDFLNPEFSREFDEFLSEKVGYPVLSGITQGLFYSPYGATSLREYFANGFENFHIKKDYNYLQIMSPVLYNKIENLLDKV